eukprot:TRINITY_DN7958_c3_g1_i1.p1 TRINITY_DN7958_c3_g1~~TRINITY_DN7958_c3_g1_i1.p1  ORF type:complete len:574 (+),score=90.77 TRINITY_DN7958_c3_g1_i1:98-1819(+)
MKARRSNDVSAIRSFDLRAELKATADRRKQPQLQPAGPGGIALASSSEFRNGGVASIAARLSEMFPGLPAETVQAVVSELFRSDPRCSRQELADRALASLLQLGSKPSTASAAGSSRTGDAVEPQTTSVTSFAPVRCGTAGESETLAPSGSSASSSASVSSASGDEAFVDQTLKHDCEQEYIILDEHLAELLALPDATLRTCFSTLGSVLDRIAKQPEETKFRQLKKNNHRFSAEVGCHEPAMAMLLLAGFQEAVLDGEPVIVFSGDPSSSKSFQNVQEAIHAALESLTLTVAIDGSNSSNNNSNGNNNRAPDTSSKTVKTSFPSTAIRSTPILNSAAARRQHIASLTELRLRDPRSYRAKVLQKTPCAGNPGVGGYPAARSQSESSTASGSAEPQRQSKHFTLTDIEKMRIDEEIAGMPSYAEEYVRRRHSEPAGNYSTLVARSYDPELLGRQALDGTNRYRASKGLAPLRWNDGIARIAREHAEQMASGKAPFSHDGFDKRVNAFPVYHRGAGENLALNKGMANVSAAAVEGWIKSPGHEKNLRGNWTLCGIGAARASDGTFYLTQLFAAA